MLAAPAEACPDTPGRAVAFLRLAVGEPIRPDAHPDLMRLLESAAGGGRGMAADPHLAVTLARHSWLVAGEREIAGWSEAESEAWLIRPETIAQIEARVAAAPTARAIWLLSGLLLRRALPAYDPARAANLLEKSPEIHRDPVRLRLGRLLSEGEHMPPDFLRAAKPFRYAASRTPDFAGPAQAALLDIGRRAAAAARSRDARLAAVSVLGSASLDSIGDSRALYQRLLKRVRAPRDGRPLPADRLEWIAAELDIGFAYNLGMLPGDTPTGIRPIELDGLIGPAGRLVTVTVTQSSGVPVRDRAVLANYLNNGPKVDFSSFANGRTMWVKLPAVDPMLSYETVYKRRRERCPACM